MALTAAQAPVAARPAPASAARTAVPATPVLLAGPDYLADAVSRIATATRRVLITTLTLADDGKTGPLIAALEAAARRGVDVRVAADVFTYIDAAGTFLPRGHRTRRKRESSAMASRLARAGATFMWLGSERGLIWRGRTHTKFCVVDDVAYAFGGVNLDDRGVSNVDFMLRCEDAELADSLDAVFARIREASLLEQGHRSLALRTTGRDEVLVDGGEPGDSIIYRRALTYARRAEHVLLVSQYCPTGELGRVIEERDHELFFNPPRLASPANRVLISASMARTGHRTAYRGGTYLHAKFMVFTLPGGRRVALTGSHNFVAGGVRLGTREIALLTQRDEVIDQLLAFHHDRVVAAAPRRR
ncbi:phosphatidylserine/phosphatidylglycerophosphate/cardiolipin synthase family protein [Demequina sp. NBRC 110057]|uniref:phospholipase D-like domain-containing protein n=1 Tax=Demequina sp. NBRC 110057 TaxID=1570346 RepID=UPI000A032F3A|nr:phospholipase D family protein [Demequina sp. NBRC 110057]